MFEIFRTFTGCLATVHCTFCDFNCALFHTPNQEQLVISGRETMTCTGHRTGEMGTK